MRNFGIYDKNKLRMARVNAAGNAPTRAISKIANAGIQPIAPNLT